MYTKENLHAEHSSFLALSSHLDSRFYDIKQQQQQSHKEDTIK